MAEGGLVTARLVAYFRAKAVGGAGLSWGRPAARPTDKVILEAAVLARRL